MLVVVNATPTVHYGYRVGVPDAGSWAELLNTDADDLRRQRHRQPRRASTTEEQPWHGFEQSLPLTLPPLAVVSSSAR